jgi:hypothetical protein
MSSGDLPSLRRARLDLSTRRLRRHLTGLVEVEAGASVPCVTAGVVAVELEDGAEGGVPWTLAYRSS